MKEKENNYLKVLYYLFVKEIKYHRKVYFCLCNYLIVFDLFEFWVGFEI